MIQKSFFITTCFVALICFLSCEHNTRGKAVVNTPGMAFDSVAGRYGRHIDRLIKSIDSSKRVEGRYTGIMGEESRTYKDFQTLCHLATDTLWYKLSHSQSAVMRVYSYKALLMKNTKLALAVGKNLENDTATVEVRDGDLGYVATVEYAIKHF
jgi:hypothetical protein